MPKNVGNIFGPVVSAAASDVNRLTRLNNFKAKETDLKRLELLPFSVVNSLGFDALLRNKHSYHGALRLHGERGGKAQD